MGDLGEKQVMTKKKKKLLLILGGTLLFLYLIGPCIAAVFEIGNRWGPKIYPILYHETVYMMTWEMSVHEAKKPRIGYWYERKYRPWFYGMYSKNDDPDYYLPIMEEKWKEK